MKKEIIFKSGSDKIIDVATDLFCTQSYHAISTPSIAERANITQPLIYYHFKTKKDLFFRCIDELISAENAEKLAILLLINHQDKDVTDKAKTLCADRVPREFAEKISYQIDKIALDTKNIFWR